jgi:hypothetical protein
MQVVRLAFGRPCASVVLALLIAVPGILSVVTMRPETFPSINIPVVNVVCLQPRCRTGSVGISTRSDISTRHLRHEFPTEKKLAILKRFFISVPPRLQRST